MHKFRGQKICFSIATKTHWDRKTVHSQFITITRSADWTQKRHTIFASILHCHHEKETKQWRCYKTKRWDPNANTVKRRIEISFFVHAIHISRLFWSTQWNKQRFWCKKYQYRQTFTRRRTMLTYLLHPLDHLFNNLLVQPQFYVLNTM